MKYLALDFETANSSPVSACSVGLSLFEDSTLLRSDVYLIRPPKQYGAFQWFNIKVHGIRPDMVADAPEFRELWPALREDVEGSVLVCHNAMFDTAVLSRTLRHFGLPLPRCRYVCTVKIAQKVWPELQNHKLDTVAEALGISLNHHEAGSDALASGLILQKALQKLCCADVDELAERIGMRVGVISPEGHVSCSTAQEIARRRERMAKEAQKKAAYQKRRGNHEKLQGLSGIRKEH